jgi:hypothetical protein
VGGSVSGGSGEGERGLTPRMGSSGPCGTAAKTEAEEEAMVGEGWRESAEVAVAGDVRGEEGSRWRCSVLNLRSALGCILGSAFAAPGP